MKTEYPVTQAVPEEDRHIGFVDMMLTWMGANCQPGSWAIGGTIAAVGFMGALGTVVFANPIAYAILALVGYISFKIGTSTMGLTRVIFGVRGTKIPTACNSLNIFGWTAMNNFFAAITISYILSSLIGTPAYGQPGSGIVLAIGAAFNGIVSLILVFWAGSRSIKVAERFMMILLMIFTTWITVVVVQTTPISSILAWRPDPSVALPIGRGADAMLAFSISWATVVGEFTRYTKSKYSATIAPMLGANLSIYWFALVGVFGVISVAIKTGVFDPNYSDPSSIAIGLGLGGVALIVVLLATITTNLVNYYVAAYNVMNLNTKLSFNQATGIAGAISIVLAWVPIIFGSFIAAFFGFVNVLGAVFPPLLAVLVVDYYLIRKGRYHIAHLESKTGPYWYRNGFNVPGIFSWIVGIILFILIRNSGFGANSIGAVIPGFLLSALFYYVFMKIVISVSCNKQLAGVEE